MRYEDIESNFKNQVIEKLKTTVKEKLTGTEKCMKDNVIFNKNIIFRLVWDRETVEKTSEQR